MLQFLVRREHSSHVFLMTGKPILRVNMPLPAFWILELATVAFMRRDKRQDARFPYGHARSFLVEGGVDQVLGLNKEKERCSSLTGSGPWHLVRL
jgi:hypothetical protein